MSLYLLQREQWISRPIELVFSYFADANNLEAITPPWLHFQIKTPGPITMGAGTQIEYYLRWRAVPVHWLTEIRDWNPPFRFIDVQLRGPYRHWEHEHIFQAGDDGTIMRDVVRYSLPFGPLGQLAHHCFVKADLERIFDYRARQVTSLMGNACSHA